MSVQWGAGGTRVAAQERAETDSSMRCLVYWILPSALLGAIGFFAGLAWLALQWIGG